MGLTFALIALWAIGGFITATVLVEIGVDPVEADSWRTAIFWPLIAFCLLFLACLYLLVICSAYIKIKRYS